MMFIPIFEENKRPVKVLAQSQRTDQFQLIFSIISVYGMRQSEPGKKFSQKRRRREKGMNGLDAKKA